MSHQEFMKLVIEAVKEDADEQGCSWRIVGVVDKPKGQRQDYEGPTNVFEHEYVDQRGVAWCEDCYVGHIYYHLGEGYYLKVWFEM